MTDLQLLKYYDQIISIIQILILCASGIKKQGIYLY